MAIRVQYGNDGSLLNLAEAAGDAQNFNQRFAMGQQLVQNAQQYNMQQKAMDLQERRLQLERMKVQQSMRTSGSPTARGARVVTNERARADLQQQAQQQQASELFDQIGFNDRQRAGYQLSAMAGDRGTAGEIIERQLMGQQQQRENFGGLIQRVQQQVGEMTPAEQASLEAAQMTGDPVLLRSTLDDIRRRTRPTEAATDDLQQFREREAIKLQGRMQYSEYREAQDAVEDMRERLLDAGMDLKTPPMDEDATGWFNWRAWAGKKQREVRPAERQLFDAWVKAQVDLANARKTHGVPTAPPPSAGTPDNGGWSIQRVE